MRDLTVTLVSQYAIDQAHRLYAHVFIFVNILHKQAYGILNIVRTLTAKTNFIKLN